LIDYNENRKDIQIDRMTEDFWNWVEQQSSKLEITADYFIMEFL
jgi:chromatin segregation and condensation protein Rec8/ScpA/Scc1 (kleisin family)